MATKEDKILEALNSIIEELENQNYRSNNGHTTRMSNIYRRTAGGSTFADVFNERYKNREAKEILDYLKRINDLTEDEEAKLKELDYDVDGLRNNSEALEDTIKKLSDTKYSTSLSSRIVSYNNLFNKIGNSLKGIGNTILGFAKPWEKADKAASQYAKTIAMTSAGMKSLTDATIKNVVHGKIGINYNMSTEELIAAQQNYIQSVGRGLRIDASQQESLAAMSAVMGGERTNELAVAFENFGVNLNGVAEHSGKMFATASKHGLSFEKYTSNVAKNIKIAQNYTFKNGLKGLESMAQKATALKLDMGQVAAFADKVSTIEGSIDVASKLQVLGGPFAAIADPLGMLTEGLMDMEGLTDRIIKMVGGLGGFNKTTGQIDVSAFNKQRIKAAAQAMGMDYSQLMESVNASAKREEIAKQINSSANAIGLDKDLQELIKNSATFNEEGKAGVSINGVFKTLDKITNSDREELLKETQDQSADIKDIARNLRSLVDIREGFTKQREANQAQMTGWLGNGLKSIINGVGQTNWLLKAIVGIQGIGALSNILGYGMNIFDMFRGGRLGSGRTLLGGTLSGRRGLFRGLLRKGAEASSNASITGSGTGGSVLSFGKGAINGGKLLKAGGIIGAVGLAGNLATDYAVDKGYIKKGGAGHTAAKVGFTSAEGAGVGLMASALAAKFAAGGSAAGPIGTAVGAILGAATGAIIGGVKMAKIKREMSLDNKLERMGIKRIGNYGARSYKLINKALVSGEISDRMRRKLERQGDFDILDAIDKKNKENSVNKNKTRISNGIFSVKNAYFNGPSFGNGKFGASISTLNSVKFLQAEKISKIKGIPETGKSITPYENQKEYAQNRNQTRGGYDINISGTIMLVSSNGQEVDITENLLSDQTFVRNLTDKIIRQTGQNNFGVQRQDVNSMGRVLMN